MNIPPQPPTRPSIQFGGVRISNIQTTQGIYNYIDFRIVPNSVLKGVEYNGKVSESLLADTLTAEKGEGRDSAMDVIERFYYGTRQWIKPKRLKEDLLELVADANMDSGEKNTLKQMISECDANSLTPSSIGSINGKTAAFEEGPDQKRLLVMAVAGYVRRIAIA